MASILKVDELRGIASAGSITVTSEGGAATQSLQQGLAKAWVNFNGTGTIAVRDSLSVSGLVDNATGDFSINFSNSMSNSNYAFQGASQLDTTGFANNSDWVNVSGSRNSSNPSTTSHRIVVGRVTTETGFDSEYIYSTYHGDLA